MTIVSILLLSGLSWFLYTKSGMGFQRLFWIALLFKIAMGIALGLVYVYYYEANDTWLFFEDATRLAALGRSDFFSYLQFLGDKSSAVAHELLNTQERSLFLVKVISICALLSGDNYWICSVYFSFISFLASWHLFRVVSHHLPQSQVAAALAFLFFPSIAFWSSGLVKETLALAGLYFIASVFLKFIHQQKLRWFDWPLILVSFWVAWNLKYYWTALFGAVLVTYLLVFFLHKRISVFQKHNTLSWIIIFILLCGGVSLLHPNFHLSKVLMVLVNNHDDFVRISDPGSIIHYHQLHDSWWSIILNSPLALVSGLLRPFVWEASGAAALLASIENLLIAALLFSSMVFWKRTVENKMILFSIVAYIVLLCVFLALSTPNLGTLSRYRVGFLPFLIFIISYRNPLLTAFSRK